MPIERVGGDQYERRISEPKPSASVRNKKFSLYERRGSVCLVWRCCLLGFGSCGAVQVFPRRVSIYLLHLH